MLGFCDLYPIFLETSETIKSRNRLNSRHRAIISWNADILRNQRVLDVGSHDGRWTFAAIKAGARHVIGIEARAHLAEKAHRTFSRYGIAPELYQFIANDAVSSMRGLKDSSIDVLMCLGFYYHTLQHMTILLEARRLGARWIIFDTSITLDNDPLLRLSYELVEDPRCSIDYARTGRRDALVGMPSKTGLLAMLDYAGFQVEFFEWQDGTVENWSDIEDYRDGMRVTLRARLRN
jgi:hypothetical protein